MRALLIAEGNRLRRDDGAAHAVLDRLASAPDVSSRALLQLTPETAADIAGYDAVIFIDSDTQATNVKIEPLELIDEEPAAPALTHIVRPAEIVAFAKALYGFAGRAFLCRIPVDDLSCGEGLSRRTSASAALAAEKVEILLGELRAGPGNCDDGSIHAHPSVRTRKSRSLR